MIKLSNNWNEIHHAILIEGDEKARDSLLVKLTEIGLQTKANPDLNQIDLEVFGIDDARDFVFWSGLKPIANERKVAVVCAKSITVEAQNSLLKCIEEPPENTHFFFVVDTARALLPTLLSRVMFYSRSEQEEQNQAREFLRSEIKGRLSMIKKFAKKEDKNVMRFLIQDVEGQFARSREASNVKSALLRRVIEASRFANIRGGSPKMILEWLSVVIPEKFVI